MMDDNDPLGPERCDDSHGSAPTGGDLPKRQPRRAKKRKPKPSSSDWVGRKLSADRYRIVDRLGEGGMGAVYRAKDYNLRCHVVIKVPHPQMLRDAAFAARFAREVRTLVRLSHPHVCPITEVGECEGVPFAVMKYLSGGSLQRRRPRFLDGRLGAMKLDEELLRWLTHVAETLDFVHSQGHVHRDVKPANILFDEYGNVYLSDFGIAKALGDKVQRPPESLTSAGMFVGTPEYTAPEVFLGQLHSARSDQYALGVVIYELLSGARPFEGPSPTAIAIKQVRTLPVLRLADTAIPEAVSHAVKRAMSLEPMERFASCAELIRAIAKGLQEESAGSAAETAKREAERKTAEEAARREAERQEEEARREAQRKAIQEAERYAAERREAEQREAERREAERWEIERREAERKAAEEAERREAERREEAARREAERRAAEEAARREAERRRLSEPPPQSITASIGTRMTLIPAGEFFMGSPDWEEVAEQSERPQHRVQISRPFYLSVCPVTVRDFAEFIELSGYRTEAELGNDWATWSSNRQFVQAGDHPVVAVSWNDAAALCDWLSRKENAKYRLPTEAEWEYACRAGSGSRYWFGDDPNRLGDHAWFEGNSGGRTCSVGRKGANAFGLGDMLGNVWEWCADWFDPRYYASSPRKDPPGPGETRSRVIRGGCWSVSADFARSALRASTTPQYRSLEIGIRLARSI